MRMQSRIGRQQRRVNIDQTATVMIDEILREDTHEAGQHNEIRLEFVDYSGQGSIEPGAIRMVVMRDHGCRNAPRCGIRQTAGIGTIADHRRDPAGQLRLHQRLHVGAAPGNQNDDFFHGSSAHLGLMFLALSAADHTNAENLLPCCLQMRDGCIGIGRIDHDDHADTAVEGAVHFLCVNISPFL